MVHNDEFKRFGAFCVVITCVLTVNAERQYTTSEPGRFKFVLSFNMDITRYEFTTLRLFIII